MKTLKIGIASYEDMKARTMAIARGQLKPKPQEPKVWFTSTESFARVLSNKNRALLAVIGEEFQAIEADIDNLYDNWFIETCAEWLVPYIGDLLGVRGLYTEATTAFSQRAYVANTLSYRRRKGTAKVLEDLARDVTGWPARARAGACSGAATPPAP